VDWHQPARNLHILDWRERANDFGLGPVDEDGVVGAPPDETPVQMLEDEEPEAFADQPLDEAERDALAPEELDERPEDRLSPQDVDLVRMYLKHIGRRKLLTSAQEQEIGRAIETARGELQAELATIPAAIETLLALADTVRSGESPAAEIIRCPTAAS
jgi:hypothetical protein